MSDLRPIIQLYLATVVFSVGAVNVEY